MRAHDYVAEILEDALPDNTQVYRYPPTVMGPTGGVYLAYQDPAREPAVFVDPDTGAVWRHYMEATAVIPASALNTDGWDWLYDTIDAVLDAFIAAPDALVMTECSGPELLDGPEGATEGAQQAVLFYVDL